MKKFISSTGLIMMVKIGFACSCFYYEADFYKNTIYTYNCLAVFDTMDYSFVYNGLNSQTGHFAIIDTIGDFKSDIGDTIVVIGQDGLNCGESLYGFSRGDTMFLALAPVPYKSLGEDTFYLEGICGKYYLEITNGQNSGLSIAEIKDKIRDKVTNVGLLISAFDFKVYPNPTSNLIYIKTNITPFSNIKVQIFNVNGIEMKDIIINNNEVDVSDLPKGIYYITIRENGSLVRMEKFIKL